MYIYTKNKRTKKQTKKKKKQTNKQKTNKKTNKKTKQNRKKNSCGIIAYDSHPPYAKTYVFGNVHV